MSKKINLDDLIKPEASAKDLSNEFEATTIDLKKEVKRPPIAISIGYDDKSYGGVFYPLKFGTFGRVNLMLGLTVLESRRW